MNGRIQTTSVLFMVAAILALAVPLCGAPAPSLVCGTSGPGQVFAYQSGTTWTLISGVLGQAVLDLIEFEGDLYAATMSSSPMSGTGRVWRYEGGTNWTMIGDNMDAQVCDLVEYNGQLYAGTAWNGGKLYRYDPAIDGFAYVGAVGGWSGVRAMYCFGGWLQLGDIGYDKFGRYDGSTFYYDLHGGGSCIYDFAEFNGALYASAYVGRLWRSTDGINWSVVLGYYDGNLWELEPFQGYLYASYDNGELAQVDSSHTRTTVWTAPSAIISMLADGDSVLYMGTGGEAGAYYGSGTGTGYVYSYSGSGSPALISGPLGTGVQCLYLPPLITVAVDIKPGSCPNPLNLDSPGSIPVAIVGMDSFDVTMVDPASVKLEGVAPLRYSYEDVCAAFYPLTGKTNARDCTTAGPDGRLDLVFHFDTPAVAQALGVVADGEVVTVHLTGNLTQEYGGIWIAGEDVMVILDKGKQ